MVLDKAGRVASTVSSGGIALKQPGRVGQAAVFGCGCWAQRGSKQKLSNTVGISTTGCGEHLVRTFLAKECAQSLRISQKPLNSLQEVMKDKFAESDFLGKILFPLNIFILRKGGNPKDDLLHRPDLIRKDGKGRRGSKSCCC